MRFRSQPGASQPPPTPSSETSGGSSQPVLPWAWVSPEIFPPPSKPLLSGSQDASAPSPPASSTPALTPAPRLLPPLSRRWHSASAGNPPFLRLASPASSCSSFGFAY